MTTAGKQRAEAVREILCSVLRDPDRNLQKLRRAAELFRGREFSAQRQLLRCALEDPSHPYYGYLRRLFSDIDLDVVARLLENFCVNDQMIGREIRESVGREFGCRVPRAVFMDPSSSGGLLCAGSPGVLPEREYRLTEETMESVVRQGKVLGIYIYAFTGREPLHCAQSLIRICEAHPDCLFLIFTDGILIDWLLAEKMRRAGNVIPVVRFCGGEEETDRRHGAGTYRRVRQALEILRGKELFFGISCKLAENTLLYGTSSDFYEDLIRQGVCFLWYSMQVPDGGTVSDSVLPDLSRRAEAYRICSRLRQQGGGSLQARGGVSADPEASRCEAASRAGFSERHEVFRRLPGRRARIPAHRRRRRNRSVLLCTKRRQKREHLPDDASRGAPLARIPCLPRRGPRAREGNSVLPLP